MGVGAVVKLLDGFGIFRSSNDFTVASARSSELRQAGPQRRGRQAAHRRHHQLLGPGRHARLPGRRLHHRARAGRAELRRRTSGVGAVRSAARLLRRAHAHRPVHGLNNGNEAAAWAAIVAHLYRFIVRPIAVGGMLVGACYTLFKMRKNLILGVKRGIADVKKTAAVQAATRRTAAGPVAQHRRPRRRGLRGPDDRRCTSTSRSRCWRRASRRSSCSSPGSSSPRSPATSSG